MVTADDPVIGLLAGRRMAYDTGEPTGVEALLLEADRQMTGGQEDLIADLALDLLEKGTA